MKRIAFLVLFSLVGQLDAAGGGYIDVKGWPLPSGRARGYNLYVAVQADGKFQKVNARPITTLHYVLNDLSPGWRYYFKLSQLSADQPPLESQLSPAFYLVAQAGPDEAAPAGPPTAQKKLDFEDPQAFRLSQITTDLSSKMRFDFDHEIKHGGQSSLKINSDVKTGSETTALLLGQSPADCPFQGLHCGNLVVWVYSEMPFELELGFREGKAKGADGVSWMSHYLMAPGGSRWSKMVFPLGQFKRFAERRSGVEMTQSFGNGLMMHLDCIVEFQIHTRTGQSVFYVDDLGFE